ncbi:cytochrome P450 4c21 isoform X1 [Bombyx mori]|uniref:Cytochrome P450 n=1 Tax=Bombyx mori TaxID=7091 RepID=A0A8R1WHP4_BOMMO|nr:cytochrome P450 4c21 isoform X2 [Bombyx mori]
MFILIVLVVVCVVLLFYSIKKSNSNVPLCDNYLPVIGHTHMLIGGGKKLLRTVKYACEEANKKGGVVILQLGLENYYVITDPEDNLTVANGELQKHYFYQFTSNWVGDGLVTSAGETWKRHRKLLNPAFSQQMLNIYTAVFNRESRNLISAIEIQMKSGPVLITAAFKEMALKTLLSTAFGIEEEECDFNQKYMHAVDELMAVLTRRLQNILLHNSFIYKLSALKKKEDELIETIMAMSNKAINSKRRALKNKQESHENGCASEKKTQSLSDLLLKGLDDEAFTDKEIRNEVDTFIAAGSHTSSQLMTVVVMVLGSYPEIQDKVYQEIKSVCGDSDADVDKLQHPRLVYTEAVLKETLRLYPIAPVVLRKTENEIKLKNYTIPANSNCLLGIYGLNRHPVWGPDAHTFRPERWLEPGGVPDDPNAFAGFSVGKRNCIGKTYALISMKTTLVHLVRRYKVTADISKIEFKMDVIMVPSDNCYVKFESRK